MSKSPENGSNAPWILMGAGALLAVAIGFGVWAIGERSARLTNLEDWYAGERERRAEAEALAQAQSARTDELQSALDALEKSTEERLTAIQAQAQSEIQQAEQELAELRSQLEEAATPAQSAPTGQSAPAAKETDRSMQAAGTAKALGLGRAAHPEEIAAWDVDVLPDGRGLPEGSGDVFTGEEYFAQHCASCHGDFAEGRGNWPSLAGGFDTLDDRDPVKTVGSYWPYLSTVWDYVHRSMPFGNAGTLTNDEVYAITAYILYSNQLVDDDFVLSDQTFAQIEMPNRDGFIVDDRPEAEYPEWRGEPCMQDCKSAPAEITRRASDVGVTPADDGSMAQSVMEERLATMGGEEWGKEVLAGSVAMMPDAETPEPAATEAAETPADTEIDPQLVAAGETVFRKCKACHAVGDGAKNKVGPHLNSVVGRTIGGLEDFKYSNAFQAAAEDGRVWDAESLKAFLADPKGYLKGTRMVFAGLKKEEDRAAIVAYLRSVSQ